MGRGNQTIEIHQGHQGREILIHDNAHSASQASQGIPLSAKVLQIRTRTRTKTPVESDSHKLGAHPRRTREDSNPDAKLRRDDLPSSSAQFPQQSACTKQLTDQDGSIETDDLDQRRRRDGKESTNRQLP